MISDERLQEIADDCGALDGYADIALMARELLALRKASRWVSCSDRMPEEDTLCFAIDEEGVIWTAHYDEGALNPDIGGQYCKPTFTHWMLHPAPPTDSTT